MHWTMLSYILLLVIPFSHSQDDTRPEMVTIRDREFEVYPAEKLRARGFDVPGIPREENAAWVYIDAMNAMVNVPGELGEAFDAATDGRWPEGEAGDKLAAWLQQNKPALDLVRRATTIDRHDMPFFRGETDAIVMVLLPTLSPARQLAKTLSVEATYRLAQGDPAAATDNYLTAHRMGQQIGNGKTLIEGLVGMAVCSLAERGLVRAAASGQADSETLKAAVREMESLAEYRPSFEQMMRAEQQWTASVIDDTMELPGGLGTFSGTSYPGPAPAPTGWTRLAAKLRRLYLPDRAMKKNLDRHFDALIEATRQKDGVPGTILDEGRLLQDIPAWDQLSRMWIPSIARVHEMTLRADSNFVRTQMTLAVEAHKAATGQYPSTLSALTPDYVSSVPTDPMTGYDFEYRAKSGAASGVTGLQRVTRDNAAELRKKRRTPAILNPRASKWRRTVQSTCESYRLTDRQRASAEAILRDMEARAAGYEQVHGAKLQQLIDAGETDELSRRMGPLDKMFTELKKRVDTLATVEQRAAAEKGE